MSLDVYLKIPGYQQPQASHSGIFVRENGQTVEVSEAEWMLRNSDFLARGVPEPARVTPSEEESDIVFTANITHNLGKMAEEAGIYECLWRPEEVNITKADQLIEPLSRGLRIMKRDPERFESSNPPNGWGSYSGFVPWIERYLIACITYPEAEVSVWR